MNYNIKMGRNKDNKISKEINKVEDEVEEENYDEEENEYVLQREYEQYETDIIWETRRKMTEYCNNLCIPLCDYLTIDVFEKFIEQISEEL
jgi:hypothetical protein